jgi:hypothetical protein
MKVPFNTIFEVNNGTITNKLKIRAGGVTAYPRALNNYRGVFGVVDFSLFINRDLEVKTDGDTWVILGIY